MSINVKNVDLKLWSWNKKQVVFHQILLNGKMWVFVLKNGDNNIPQNSSPRWILFCTFKGWQAGHESAFSAKLQKRCDIPPYLWFTELAASLPSCSHVPFGIFLPNRYEKNCKCIWLLGSWHKCWLCIQFPLLSSPSAVFLQLKMCFAPGCFQ